MQRIRDLFLPLFIAAVLLAAGCTGGDEESAPSGSRGEDAELASEALADTTASATAEAPVETTTAADGSGGGEADSDEPAASGEEGAAPAGGPTVPVALQPQDIGRDIVFTASVEVAVPDVARAAEEALLAVQAKGGLLFGQETRDGRSLLTFKVAPGDFQEVLRALGGLGELRSQTVTADDVTERIVDLESRIVTAERSVARLNEFLASAANLGDLATFEAQLLERETVLEQLRGQLRTLQNQVSLATIVLSIVELVPPAPRPGVELAQTAYLGHDAGFGCPGDSSLTADEGTAATVCFVVTNKGNVPLVDIVVHDEPLGLDPDELIVVSGDPSQPLEPEGTLVFAAEIEVADDVRTGANVTASPADEDGEPLERGRVGHRARIDIDSQTDDSLPGVDEALSAGWSALLVVLTLLALALAVALPFIWVVPVGAVVAWLARRRRGRARRTDPAEEARPERVEV